MEEKIKGFRPYEKVANILATNKELDPRLTGLWYLIGEKIVCKDIEEDSEDFKDILEIFTTDPIALQLITKLAKWGANTHEIRIHYKLNLPKHDGDLLRCISDSNDYGDLIVKYHSNYIAVYDYMHVPVSMDVYIWNICES